MHNNFKIQLNNIQAGESRPKSVPKSSVQKLGILGSGLMGHGICYVAAITGIEVSMIDVTIKKAQKGLNKIESISNTHSLGQILYTDYIHIFQISGMILLVAMIGAIVLTFRQREGVKKQNYIKQISRERSEGVELVKVERNKGVNLDD